MRVSWTIFLACLFIAVQPVQADYPINPLATGDSIFVSQQGVYRFSPDQAEPLWSSLRGVETFEPVAWKNLILVGSTQGLYALDRENGRINWHVETWHTLFTPAVADQAYAGSLHGELYAIDPGSGKIIWRKRFLGWIYSPAISAGSAQLWTAGQAHRISGLSAKNGNSLRQIETSQEAVFSPVELAGNRVAVNLFDGSTVVIETTGSKIVRLLKGDSQPTGLQTYGERIYRSHRNGTLSVFDAASLDLEWRKSILPQDLTLHPSRPGNLLMSDRDSNLILLNGEGNDAICRLKIDGQWTLPLQITDGKIIYFQKTLQPPGLTLVNTLASCK